MKRNMLVLGGGSGQLGLLENLRRKDITIVLQDRNPDCPGRRFADIFIRADTFDADAAAGAAKTNRVDGVLTAGTDQPVLAAALAARARGCPALHSPETAIAATDKEAMKTALAARGIPTPAFAFADSLSEAEKAITAGLESPGDAGVRRSPEESLSSGSSGYPLVVKPVDSQGQRGVLRVDYPHELRAACSEALGYSRRKRIVIEHHHRHREVTVSGWMHSGRLQIWAVTDRVTREFPPHIGLCMAHRYPSLYARGREDAISGVTRRCVAALGLTEGPIYFQFLLTDNDVLVNECAARLGGAYEDVSLPPVCGVDPIDLLIEGSLEGGADSNGKEFQVPVSASAFSVPLMFCRPGKIAALEGARGVRGIPGITAFEFLLAPGTVIHPPKNSVQRAAWLVAHGDGTTEVNRILRRAVPRISVTDGQGRQLLRNPLGYALNGHN